jgi:hypothetical protein
MVLFGRMDAGDCEHRQFTPFHGSVVSWLFFPELSKLTNRSNSPIAPWRKTGFCVAKLPAQAGGA